jgi:hypothetical protein
MEIYKKDSEIQQRAEEEVVRRLLGEKRFF